MAASASTGAAPPQITFEIQDMRIPMAAAHCPYSEGYANTIREVTNRHIPVVPLITEDKASTFFYEAPEAAFEGKAAAERSLMSVSATLSRSIATSCCADEHKAVEACTCDDKRMLELCSSKEFSISNTVYTMPHRLIAAILLNSFKNNHNESEHLLSVKDYGILLVMTEKFGQDVVRTLFDRDPHILLTQAVSHMIAGVCMVVKYGEEDYYLEHAKVERYVPGVDSEAEEMEAQSMIEKAKRNTGYAEHNSEDEEMKERGLSRPNVKLITGASIDRLVRMMSNKGQEKYMSMTLILLLKIKLVIIVSLFIPLIAPFLMPPFPPSRLRIFATFSQNKNNTATGLGGWRPSEIKQLPDCLLSALLDVFHLCETQGYFLSSFYYSYTTLIPKGVSRTPLSLRPITGLPVPYRIYASLRCQTLLTWQKSWIHPSQFAFCKGRSTTSLNSHVSFDLLHRYQSYQSFAGIQFDFAKCFDSIPYSVIWDELSYHGCDTHFITLLRHLYTNMHRIATMLSLRRMYRLFLESYQWFITRGSFECCYSQLCSSSLT